MSLKEAAAALGQRSMSLSLSVSNAGKRSALEPINMSGPGMFHAARLAAFLVLPLCLTVQVRLDRVTPHSAFSRLICWSVLTELTGFGTMDGPLGSGHGVFTPLWFRLTVRSLKVPSLSVPFISFLSSRTRTLFDVVVFATTAAALLIGTFAPTDGAALASAQLAVVTWSLLCLLDRSAYVGAMGAYYFPLLLMSCCLGAGREITAATESSAVVALQLIQVAHLLIAGVAKAGPWFRHVSPSMLGAAPNFVFLPRGGWARTALFADATAPNGEADLSPAPVAASLVAAAGVLTETVVPIMWLFESSRFTACIIIAGMHVCIIIAAPVGAVAEWNACNLLVEAFLFIVCPPMDGGAGVSGVLSSITSMVPWHCLFVVFCEFVGPLCGHVWPDACSNHFALRKYTGNHPFHILLCRRGAASKLDKLPSACSLSQRVRTEPPWPAHAQSLATLATLVRGRLNTKPLPHILETHALPKGSKFEEYMTIASSHWLGQTMLDVTLVDDIFLSQLGRGCNLGAGDVISVRISSFPTFVWPWSKITNVYAAKWSAVDAGTSQLVAAGTIETGWTGSTVSCKTSHSVSGADCREFDAVGMPANRSV